MNVEAIWLDREPGETDEQFAARRRRVGINCHLSDLRSDIRNGETKQALERIYVLLDTLAKG